MNKILTTILTLTIISNCSNISEITPKVEIKKEDPFEVARQSCLAENAQGCIDFGWIMVEQKDYKLAKTAFGMAYDYGDKDAGMRGHSYVKCLEKNAASCWLLGYYAEDGIGGSQDYKLARKFYQKAIDLGDTDFRQTLL